MASEARKDPRDFDDRMAELDALIAAETRKRSEAIARPKAERKPKRKPKSPTLNPKPRLGPAVCLDCNSRTCEHVMRPPTRTLQLREVRVLVLLSGGLSNREIGAAAGLTPGTVKQYLSALFPKIGATSRFSAALWALRNLALLEERRGTQP